jgi:hypothetical protein
MGVRIVPAMTPLDDKVRSKIAPLAAPPEMRVKPTPYDAAVQADAAAFDSAPGAGFDTDPVASAIVPAAAPITGTGDVLVLDPSQNNTFRALNNAWSQNATVQFSAGRYAIGGLSQSAQDDLVKTLALSGSRRVASTALGDPVIKRPRIGLFQPWAGSMDEGWTRWLLRQYGFPLTSIHPEDFQSPLGSQVDVLVLADDARVPIAGVQGTGRNAVTRPEHAYQLTADDLHRFEEFVRSGGTLVCLNNASNFAIQQFALPIRNVAANLPAEEFFLRGSLVEVLTTPEHQIMAGMPESAAVFVDSSPVFEMQDGFAGTVLARYAQSGSPLLSGYLIGEKILQGRAAAVDVTVGNGRIVLIGFRPEWRGQPFGTFKVLFNAVLSSNRR